MHWCISVQVYVIFRYFSSLNELLIKTAKAFNGTIKQRCKSETCIVRNLYGDIDGLDTSRGDKMMVLLGELTL